MRTEKVQVSLRIHTEPSNHRCLNTQIADLRVPSAKMPNLWLARMIGHAHLVQNAGRHVRDFFFLAGALTPFRLGKLAR